jgi:hypothetical protein
VNKKLVAGFVAAAIIGLGCNPEAPSGERPKPENADPKPTKTDPGQLTLTASWARDHRQVTVAWTIDSVERYDRFDPAVTTNMPPIIIKDEGRFIELAVTGTARAMLRCAILRRGRPVLPDGQVVSSRGNAAVCYSHGK